MGKVNWKSLSIISVLQRNCCGLEPAVQSVLAEGGRRWPHMSVFLPFLHCHTIFFGPGGSVRCALDWLSGHRCWVWQHSFVEIDLEIFSTVIPFHGFKKGSCQFLAKRCAQVLVNCLDDKACQEKVWLVNWSWHDLKSVDWAVNLQTNQPTIFPLP